MPWLIRSSTVARTLYIASLEQDTGKSVVALGVMDMLAGLVSRVGFFRPVIAGGRPDHLITLFCERYQLVSEPTQMFGVTYDDVNTLTAAGRLHQLGGRVVGRF